MFGTRTIVAMGQEHDETILHVPFRFTRNEELINNYLCTVGKITELCLPQAKSIWMGLGVSQFVTQDSKFREMRVGCNKSSHVSLRDNVIDWNIITVFVLIKHMSMSVRECSSLNVLA